MAVLTKATFDQIIAELNSAITAAIAARTQRKHMIGRMIIDVWPANLDITENQLVKIREELRDYLNSVVLPDFGVTVDHKEYGEGTPRWSHLHDGTVKGGCPDCRERATDKREE